jgi:hypothetical protein
MKHPWDIRPPAEKGDSDDRLIFYAVGRALTEWEQVENTCAQLFAIFVSATYRQAYQAPAVRAYGCIVGVKSRSAMLREAGRAYFARHKAKAQYEKQVGDLIKEYIAFSDRRNEIAHAVVSKDSSSQKEIQRAVGDWAR